MKSKGGIAIGIAIGVLLAAGAIFYFLVFNKSEAPPLTSPAGEEETVQPTVVPTTAVEKPAKTPTVAPKKPSPIEDLSSDEEVIEEEEEIVE